MGQIEQLARYAAGPIALASLGVGLRSSTLAAAVVAWTLAGVWGTAALIAWRKEHLGVKGRAFRLANRIRRCVPGWWAHPDYGPRSVYGDDISMARDARVMEERRGRRIHPFWKRRYTKRLHRRVERVIEEMGELGGIDFHLRPYLVERPKPGQYPDLARNLWWTASKLP